MTGPPQAARTVTRQAAGSLQAAGTAETAAGPPQAAGTTLEPPQAAGTATGSPQAAGTASEPPRGLSAHEGWGLCRSVLFCLLLFRNFLFFLNYFRDVSVFLGLAYVRLRMRIPVQDRAADSGSLLSGSEERPPAILGPPGD